MAFFETIREDIRCVFERDPAARNVWEVLTCYPGLKALWGHRVSHWLWRHRLRWLARMNSQFARFLTGIEIHPGATIGRRFFIDHGMGVVIGETAEIGDNVTLYHQVTLGGTVWDRGKRHPTLRDNVVVGAGAKVLGPITLGVGVRVGSNSVVVRDVDDGATVVGIPARVVAKPRQPSERIAAMAARMGFDAYGLTRDTPDPVADAINAMLDHMHTLDERVVTLCKHLNAQGESVPSGDIASVPKPEFCRELDADEAAHAATTAAADGNAAESGNDKPV